MVLSYDQPLALCVEVTQRGKHCRKSPGGEKLQLLNQLCPPLSCPLTEKTPSSLCCTDTSQVTRHIAERERGL